MAIFKAGAIFSKAHHFVVSMSMLVFGGCIWKYQDLPNSQPFPIGSMYGIFTYIWLKFMVNVGKYTIHGSSRFRKKTSRTQAPKPRQAPEAVTWSLMETWSVIWGEIHKIPTRWAPLLGCPRKLGSMVSKWLFHLPINGVYWSYNPLTNHLLSSWDILVQ